MVEQPQVTGYGHVREAYAAAGWPTVPMHGKTKVLGVKGHTGQDGVDATPEQREAWSRLFPFANIALRMPADVIGIDVDAYTKDGALKHGPRSLAAAVERWGPLPPTWSSTARGIDVTGMGQPPGTTLILDQSRIMFFRLSGPRRLVGQLPGGDVEILQRHHRYAVVWPSINPDSGNSVYRWYAPTGDLLPPGEFPAVADLPFLPSAWEDGLADGASPARERGSDEAGDALLTTLLADQRPPCGETAAALADAQATLGTSDIGSRHDAMLAATFRLVALGAAGHIGVGAALHEVGRLWSTLVGPDRTAELHRAGHGAAAKAIVAYPGAPLEADPCGLFAQGAIVVTPADQPRAVTAAPQIPTSWRAHVPLPWETSANTDSGLAIDAIVTMAPVLRFAQDSGQWLIRGPARWTLSKDLAASVVTALGDTLPRGNSKADDGSPEKLQASRRARLRANAGISAVASVMRAKVMDPDCPIGLLEADLDQRPDLLWAGGVAWDLRAGVDRPVVADVDPSTPHLHSAAVLPDLAEPTPIWTALCAAVFPDPAVRAWALRVLAIGLTGYPDRALPVLVGRKGHGKSSIVEAVLDVLGTYGLAANRKLVSSAGDTAHDSLIYALRGRRTAWIDEAPRDTFSVRERLKQLTGGARLTGNAMRANPVEFKPTHTLVMAANEPPDIDDAALRDRMRLIPCIGDPDAVAVVAGAKSTHAGAWRAEWPGVLAQLMIEAARWMADYGSATTAGGPDTVQSYEAEVADDQDIVGQWLTARTERDENGTATSTLYAAFHDWCRDALRLPKPIPRGAWVRKLAERGVEKTRTESERRLCLRLTHGGGMSGFGYRPVPTASMTFPADMTHPKVSSDAGTPSEQANGLTPVAPNAIHVLTQPAEMTDLDALGEDVSGGHVIDVSPGQAPVSGDQMTHDTSDQVLSSLSNTTTNSTYSSSDIGENRETVSGVSGVSTPETDPEDTDADPPPPPAKAPSARVLATLKAREHATDEASGEHVGLPALAVRHGSRIELTALTGVPGWDVTVRKLLSALDIVAVDCESTGYPIGHADHALRTVQLGGPDFAVDLDADDPDQLRLALDVLDAAPRLEAHSAAADLAPLAYRVAATDGPLAGERAHEGWWAKMWDTGIPGKLLDPAGTQNGSDLKSASERHVPDAVSPAADEARDALFTAAGWKTEVKPHEPIEKSGWAQADHQRATMIRYDCADVLDAARLGPIGYADPRITPDIVARERRVQHIVSRAAYVGLALDMERVTERTRHATAERRALGERMHATWGLENPGSPMQVGSLLVAHGAALPSTSTGKPSTAKGVIEPLQADDGPVGEIVRTELEWRHHDTALKLLLRPWAAMSSGDQRLRPTVYTLGADTGRMSCVRPNLQQVSREGGLRECIVADEGYQVIAADFAGIELRVAAALSGDTHLQQLIRDGVDVHALIAAYVWGQTDDKQTAKRRRYQAKRIVFGRLYGGGLDTLAAQAGLGHRHDLVTRALDAMDEITPGVVTWSKQVNSMIRGGQTQYQTYSGRVIHLDKRYPHKAPNYLIQGTARELLVDALLRWDASPHGGGVILPIHDEIVAMVPTATADDALATLMECMTTELGGVGIVAESGGDPAPRWRSAA